MDWKKVFAWLIQIALWALDGYARSKPRKKT